MNTARLRQVVAAFAGLAAATVHLAAYPAVPMAPLRLGPQGETYPSRSIRMVVPFPPGASTDSIARIIAEPIETALGRRLTVENRSGAGGNIGAETVTRAAPDGHTWLLGTAGLMSINALIYPSMTFDPALALAPVTLAARVPYVLVVHPSVPVRSVAALIDFARRRPWILNYGSAGNGSTVHLAAEMFKAATDTRIVHIPYRGGAPAVGELLGGHIHMMFSSVPLALPLIESRRVRPLAVTGPARSVHLPDVPTMLEEGLADFEFTGWFAILVPTLTSPRIIAWLNEELVAVLTSPQTRARLHAIGAEPATSTPAQVHELIRRDTGRWRRIVQSAKIKPDWEDYPQ